MKRVVPFVVLLMLLAGLSSARSISSGTAQSGTLLHGFEIPITNPWIHFYQPVARRGTHFATVETVALLVRVARVVRNYVGGPRLSLGDCSAEEGGDLGNHRSHNSGRDVDILFYRVDSRGRPVLARSFTSYDGRGRCRGKGCGTRFDVERNWWVVRTLVASQVPGVQYVFVSQALRELLLAHAKRRGEDPEILYRARRVLREPSDSSSHADHFHVRVYCSDEDRRNGCRDSGARWEWLERNERASSRAREKTSPRARARP